MLLSQRTPPAQRHPGQAGQLLPAIWKSLINFLPLGANCCSSVTFPFRPSTPSLVFWGVFFAPGDDGSVKRAPKEIIGLIKAKGKQARCVWGREAGHVPGRRCVSARDVWGNQGLIPQITQLSNKIQLIPLKLMSGFCSNTTEASNEQVLIFHRLSLDIRCLLLDVSSGTTFVDLILSMGENKHGKPICQPHHRHNLAAYYNADIH